MDTNLILKPNSKHLYQLQAERSHPRLSLTRVLTVKFLRWIDKSSLQALLKTLRRLGGIILLSLLIFAPRFTVTMMVMIFTWRSFRIPVFLGVLFCLLNWRRLYRFVKHGVSRGDPTGNASTYEGIPVDQLASYLHEHGFKRDHAIQVLGISKFKHEKIARELERHDMLTRDENNGRILNPALTRELLVRQLREKFPLRYVDGQWAEYRGSYERFLRDKEKREQEERTSIERLERRKERLQGDIESLGFIRRDLTL